MTTPTDITVRVIAVDGKFLADDIGGALITIRDFQTRELLSSGVTKGDSGPKNLMCVSATRSTPVPMDPTTAAYTTTIQLSAPLRVEVSAYGPLAARASANTVTATTWLYPGINMTAGNGLLLQMPGLITQIVNPPAHTTSYKSPADVLLVANVAMMCGCPISDKAAGAICEGPTQPWTTADFLVMATVQDTVGDATRLMLKWDKDGNVPGRFTAWWLKAPAGTYAVTVVASQVSTGNTGVDFSTVIVS